MTKEELNKCSKEELIRLLEYSMMFINLRYSEVLSNRWEKRSNELISRRKDNLEFLQSIDTKERDRLAHLFNNETDHIKRLAILEKMDVYSQQMKIHNKEYEVIRKEEKKLERLYSSIDNQRKKENVKTK